MCYSYPIKNASRRAVRPTIELKFCLVWARKAGPLLFLCVPYSGATALHHVMPPWWISTAMQRNLYLPTNTQIKLLLKQSVSLCYISFFKLLFQLQAAWLAEFKAFLCDSGYIVGNHVWHTRVYKDLMYAQSQRESYSRDFQSTEQLSELSKNSGGNSLHNMEKAVIEKVFGRGINMVYDMIFNTTRYIVQPVEWVLSTSRNFLQLESLLEYFIFIICIDFFPCFRLYLVVLKPPLV